MSKRDRYRETSHNSQKRKRSVSPSYRNRGSSSSKYKPPERESLSFTVYKFELNKTIGRFGKECIISDLPDFWLFLTKFEAVMKKRAQNSPIKPKSAINTEGIPEKITKDYYEKTEKLKDINNIYARLPIHDPDYNRRPKLTIEKFEEFLQVVQHYLDFKLRETCTKIRKLFETQKNLPVYEYQ